MNFAAYLHMATQGSSKGYKTPYKKYKDSLFLPCIYIYNPNYTGLFLCVK